MTKERLELGKTGEEIAFRKIKKLGYKCLERNYRCPLGEIDLIARHKDCLVFIEIKTRKGRDIGYAKEAIDLRKKRQISKAALYYLKEKNCPDIRSRFDVVAVSINQEGLEIEVIENAFELTY
jgi:putative endonuclease